ncbi:hypothetical protein HDU97_004910 [Phlyctochytrium planicorne]|nr:hypothetical protein HDU97_004910 [Phlyctochytrium planicorne]
MSPSDAFNQQTFDAILQVDHNFYGRNWRVYVAADYGYYKSQHTNFPIILLVVALVEPVFAILFHSAIVIIRKIFPEFGNSRHE